MFIEGTVVARFGLEAGADLERPIAHMEMSTSSRGQTDWLRSARLLV